MKNIVLIGMPGSGKTTIGERVARALGRPWYDSDTLIEQREGMPITDLFAHKGEDYFRARERECLVQLRAERGAVISAGGGAVLHDEALLREGATVVYLERSVDSILRTLDDKVRPLARGGAAQLEALYDERRPLYESLCDITVTNNGPLDATIQLFLEELPCDCLY